ARRRWRAGPGGGSTWRTRYPPQPRATRATLRRMATEGRRAGSAAPQPRFAVVYRWKLRAGGEERFAAAWGAVTAILRERCGALGSRLHRADDGTHVAYAQWPSRDAWKSADPEGGDVLAW